MKGHPRPSYPANPTFVPPLPQEPPVIDLSPQHTPSFNPYHHYTGSSSQTARAPLTKPTTCPPPPATPIFVEPPPSTLHRSSENRHSKPKTTSITPRSPPSKSQIITHIPPRFNLPIETEKLPKNPEQEEMFRKLYTQPPSCPQWRAPTPQNTYPAPQNAYPPPRTYQNPAGPGFRPKPVFRNERLQRKKTFTQLGESYQLILEIEAVGCAEAN
ncbi:PREDICTED: extensin-like [Nicotiana attenuata]|uniref:extensin-like n=1 Tax=Nicotiana attenuata TaxID=49451 RepID=UPI0009048D76|nr:PREDICTED: extensin-like [Nicotiana attenuata]